MSDREHVRFGAALIAWANLAAGAFAVASIGELVNTWVCIAVIGAVSIPLDLVGYYLVMRGQR